jgi:hypothetical protein
MVRETWSAPARRKIADICIKSKAINQGRNALVYVYNHQPRSVLALLYTLAASCMLYTPTSNSLYSSRRQQQEHDLICMHDIKCSSRSVLMYDGINVLIEACPLESGCRVAFAEGTHY